MMSSVKLTMVALLSVVELSVFGGGADNGSVSVAVPEVQPIWMALQMSSVSSSGWRVLCNERSWLVDGVSLASRSFYWQKGS